MVLPIVNKEVLSQQFTSKSIKGFSDLCFVSIEKKPVPSVNKLQLQFSANTILRKITNFVQKRSGVRHETSLRTMLEDHQRQLREIRLQCFIKSFF